tara:strand:- start:213 stop:386 length:174 start_codon:yes stop_codon:yes gene_type:complete
MAAQHGDGSTARRWQHNTAMAALQVMMDMQVTELQAVMTAKIADAAFVVQQPCHTRR